MRRTLHLVVCALITGCANLQPHASPAPACRWPVAPVVLRQAADTVFLSWTFPTRQLPEEAESARLPTLAAFLDTVRMRAGTADPRSLLRRQIGYYANRPDSDSQGEAANGRMVLSGSVGVLRPISCLEALLVEYQGERYPMASHPTEFHAVIMERGEGETGQTRVYFTASSAPWPPKGDSLFDAVAADRRAGWRAVAHLHNHPFLFNGGDIAGANAPSLTDVQFWRHLREAYEVESARVTNGITTFDAPAAAFDSLRARR